jgi:hypothetical protein
MKKRRGRPPRPLIVPSPFKIDEWIEIGGYDKTWPAVSRMRHLMREGVPRAKALETAAAEFNVKEQSISDWINRRRKRGPIAHYDYPDDDYPN